MVVLLIGVPQRAAFTRHSSRFETDALFVRLLLPLHPAPHSVKKQESRHVLDDGRTSLKKHIQGNSPVTEFT